MVDMSTYLTTKVADYTATELTITPNNILIEEGQKRQYFHEYDSGDIEVVTTAGSFFTVKIQWDWLSYTDAATILDFFHDSTKANAKKNTFYWLHPVDGNTYVVRFGTDLTQIDTVENPNTKQISQITLKVECVKA
jgi:hypothetical protein